MIPNRGHTRASQRPGIAPGGSDPQRDRRGAAARSRPDRSQPVVCGGSRRSGSLDHWANRAGGAARRLLDVLCRVGAVLGLNLVLRAYPSADAVRDAGHVALLERLLRRLPPGIAWGTRCPCRSKGTCGRGTRSSVRRASRWRSRQRPGLADLQAVERRVGLKQRDGAMPRVVILVARTAANRRALAIGRAALRPTYPLDTREVMTALLDGRQPPANGS